MIHTSLQCTPVEYLRGSGLNELDSVKYMQKLLIEKQDAHAKIFKEIADIQNEIREAEQSAQQYIQAAEILQAAIAAAQQRKGGV